MTRYEELPPYPKETFGERLGRHLFPVFVAVAVVLSWSANKSILWALLHGFLGGFYIIYFAIWGATP